MKKYAIFLPQFHVIKENNDWWGNGFTEWSNVKKALPIYKEHKQPIEPLNNNYYDLLDKNTVTWQTKLLNDYSLDGFIYYHYYFKGRKLLEKPAENLLKWKEISQNFFFCWANHTWKKTWNGEQTILVEQEYGNINDWEAHFKYLLPFFKDDRYEKKDNKPLFMLFDCCFEEKDEIMTYFDKRCREEGFNGIYVIETVKDLSSKSATKMPYEKIAFIREPSVSLAKYSSSYPYRFEYVLKKCTGLALKYFNNNIGFRLRKVYSGEKLYRIMINQNKDIKNNIYGVFFFWDNTSRHKDKGYVITSPKKEQFFKYMETIKNSEYVFFNAWNEWCEGMILEPTRTDKYKYLEWIKEWSELNG